MQKYKYDSGLYPAVPPKNAHNQEMKHCWIRDNFYIYEETGDMDIVRAFQKIIQKQKDNIEKAIENPPEYDGYHLHPRFTKDLEEVEGDWGFVQIDSYANLLEIFSRHRMTEEAHLMYRYIESLNPLEREEHGIWEEKKAVHPYTMACLADAYRAYGVDSTKFEYKFKELLADAEPDMSLALVLYREPVWLTEAFRNHIIELIEPLQRKYGMARFEGDNWDGLQYQAETEPSWILGGLWLYEQGVYDNQFMERIHRTVIDNQAVPEAMINTEDGWFANYNTPLLWAEATYRGVMKTDRSPKTREKSLEKLVSDFKSADTTKQMRQKKEEISEKLDQKIGNQLREAK